ncbi:MAG: hypothetical protein NWF02_02025 [Candidatus Bathyarchaeota archaeon]|nr:hypothetical protein [Candidatus Bathyarchaeum sp.]
MHAENYSITIEQNKNSIPQSEANWVEVDSVAGNGAQFGYTSSFDINHIEWRIRWEYTPLYDFGTQNDFGFSVVPEENKIDGIYTSNMSIASVKHPIEQNGTLHFNNLTGTFYLYFSPGNTNWKISIEENITSIPEFPSWIILPLFISVTLTMLFVSNKIQRKDLE